jgi:hypothetical protein
MRMVYRVVLCCAFCLLTFSVASAQRPSPSKTFHTEGVFSNIAATEGGDYAGMQIYLTDADGQFYATVTIAQGVLLPPVLVKVKAQVEARRIEFEIPSGDATRKFTGVVTADALTLIEDGNRIALKRKCD